MLVCDRVSECNHPRVRSPLEFSPKRHNPLTHGSLYRNEDKGQPDCFLFRHHVGQNSARKSGRGFEGLPPRNPKLGEGLLSLREGGHLGYGEIT